MKEVKSPRSGYNAYKAERFRKVDYNFAENILNNIKPMVRETEPIRIKERDFATAAILN